MKKKGNSSWVLQLISISICLSFMVLAIIVFNMCKGGANLILLLVFFSISTVIWGIYVVSSFMSIFGIQPISGGVNVRLLVSIAYAILKSDNKSKEEQCSYYCHAEAKAKFWLTFFFTTAVFSYALHWILSIVLISCSFIVYFYIKKRFIYSCKEMIKSSDNLK